MVSDIRKPVVAADPARYTTGGRLRKNLYEAELARLQTELVKLQFWIQETGTRALVIFEGRGSAGKGGVIKRINVRTSPRIVRVVALPKPTERERTQWYFQRYVEHLPAAGELVLFDRSWYNRSGVEYVMGFCTEDQHREFLRSCPELVRRPVRRQAGGPAELHLASAGPVRLRRPRPRPGRATGDGRHPLRPSAGQRPDLRRPALVRRGMTVLSDEGMQSFGSGGIIGGQPGLDAHQHRGRRGHRC